MKTQRSLPKPHFLDRDFWGAGEISVVHIARNVIREPVFIFPISETPLGIYRKLILGYPHLHTFNPFCRARVAGRRALLRPPSRVRGMRLFGKQDGLDYMDDAV